MEKTIDISALTEEQLAKALADKRKEKEAQLEAEKKSYEKDNEEFIESSLSKAMYLSEELQTFKDFVIREANVLYARMYELEGRSPKEVKTFQRVNKKSNLKVVVAAQERFVFTDEADVHLTSISETLKNKFQDRNKGFYKFFERVMMRNSKGEFDPKLLYKAKSEAKELGEQSIIDDLNKLDDCQRVVGTSLYCRFYKKDGKGKWQDISLNFSSI